MFLSFDKGALKGYAFDKSNSSALQLAALMVASTKSCEPEVLIAWLLEWL